MSLISTPVGILAIVLSLGSCTATPWAVSEVPAPVEYEEQEIDTICDTVVRMIRAYYPPASTILNLQIDPASRDILSQRLPLHLARVGFGLAGEGSLNSKALPAYVEVSSIEEGVFLKVAMRERTVSTWLPKSMQGQLSSSGTWTLTEAKND
ncbi:MAG: hypothetical protein JKY29_00060 [Gammaproteobacteria bacterium]|nr:hypothetical protein [Gammaproteobacteria bacterium]